jgi:crotonobetainyl-CoA:carnitine CoA-transferase CaiB-like acyl-CoA transferase
MWSVIGILSALHRRDVTGEGCTVDTSLFETALSWIASASGSVHATGRAPGRRGTENPGLVPYRVFEASDGYLMIAAGNDNLFRRLATAVGKADWLNDERFATNPRRVENRAMVNGAVQDVIGTKTVAEWLAIIEPVGVPVAPLQTIDQVIAHPQTQALGMQQQSPDAPDMTLMALPLSFNGERPALRNAPPKLGQHSAMVLERGASENKK